MTFDQSEPNIVQRDGELVFFGTPSSDSIRQVATVLVLWNRYNQFPVTFTQMSGFTDSSAQHVNDLTKNCTQSVKGYFAYLAGKTGQKELSQLTQNLLLKLTARGIFTMHGFRKTTASQEIPWPSIV